MKSATWPTQRPGRRETAEKIEDSIQKSEHASRSAQGGKGLEEIVEKARKVDALVADIATASKEQSEGVQQGEHSRERNRQGHAGQRRQREEAPAPPQSSTPRSLLAPSREPTVRDRSMEPALSDPAGHPSPPGLDRPSDLAKRSASPRHPAAARGSVPRTARHASSAHPGDSRTARTHQRCLLDERFKRLLDEPPTPDTLS